MRDRASSRRVAFTAVFTALSAAFLYLASVFPTGQLGILGVASLFGVASVVEYALPGGVFVWLGTSILGFILVPSKGLVWLYAVFFGPYPVVKLLAERMRRPVEWIIKVVFFNAALTVAIFALKFTMLNFSYMRAGTLLMYLLGNGVFILFDLAVSRAVRGYMTVIHPKIHK